MRIGFCGTMSVGKSTIVKELQLIKEFQSYVIETERSKEIRDKGVKLNTDSTLLGQLIFSGYRASELLLPNIITDRTIIDVMAFTRLAKSIPYHICGDYEKLMSHLIPEYDYIFYISPEGIPIENNGVRETDPEYRNKIDKEIQKIISEYRNKIRNLIILSGTTEERIEKIKSSIFI